MPLMWLQALCSSASATFVNMSAGLEAASSDRSTKVVKENGKAKWVGESSWHL